VEVTDERKRGTWRPSRGELIAVSLAAVLGGAAEPPEVQHGGTADLDFGTSGVPARRGRFNVLHAVGRHGAEHLSFQVAISRDAGVLTQPDGVELRSDGANSDAFVRMLARLYKLPVRPGLRMHATVPFAAYIYDGDPLRVAHSRVEFKLYHGANADAPDYCELYLNVDLPHQRIELRERDPGYRRTLLGLLSQ
jgi:hypothetical protein